MPHSRSGFKQLTKSWIIQSAATPKSFFRKAKLPLLYLLLLCFTLDCDHQWGVRCLPVRRRWIQPGVITKQHLIRSCCSSEKYIISDSKLSVSPQRNSHSFWYLSRLQTGGVSPFSGSFFFLSLVLYFSFIRFLNRCSMGHLFNCRRELMNFEGPGETDLYSHLHCRLSATVILITALWSNMFLAAKPVCHFSCQLQCLFELEYLWLEDSSGDGIYILLLFSRRDWKLYLRGKAVSARSLISLIA